MCGRVAQHRELKAYARAVGLGPDASLPNAPARYNAAPNQHLLVLRRHPDAGEKQLGLLKWGLIPH
jgi:putative SOS response-associated peptidase YedK